MTDNSTCEECGSRKLTVTANPAQFTLPALRATCECGHSWNYNNTSPRDPRTHPGVAR